MLTSAVPWRDDGGQIIVTHPVAMVIPTETGRRIHPTGSISTYSPGGTPGTKGEYSGEVLALQAWHYAQ